MKRMYEDLVKQFFRHHQEMLFLMGPRHVGKTTIAEALKNDQNNVSYFNWDIPDHKADILRGSKHLVSTCDLSKVSEHKPILILR